jgi:hypothetical protein
VRLAPWRGRDAGMQDLFGVSACLRLRTRRREGRGGSAMVAVGGLRASSSAVDGGPAIWRPTRSRVASSWNGSSAGRWVALRGKPSGCGEAESRRLAVPRWGRSKACSYLGKQSSITAVKRLGARWRWSGTDARARSGPEAVLAGRCSDLVTETASEAPPRAAAREWGWR